MVHLKHKRLIFLSAVIAVFLGSQPVTAVTLRVGAASRPPGLGNPFESIATMSSHTRSSIFDGLTVQSPEGRIEPALATSWEPTSDTTWRFTLRPNVTFSNGEPLDAAAVKASLDYIIKPESARYLIAEETRAIERVEIVDDLTVDIFTSYPDAVLPKRLSLVMIMPPKAFAEMGMDEFAQHPIGTGPYILDDWGARSGRTVLIANPGSWRAPEQIDRVELIAPLRDAVVRLQALRSGQVDITLNISTDDMEAMEAEGFINTVVPIAVIQSLGLPNVGNPGSPLRDVRVRRALNYAINKEAITEVIMGGTVNPSGQGAIPGTFGYDPTIRPFPYDPSWARALLAESGYPDGFSLKAETLVSGTPGMDTVFIQVAQDLAAVGVEMEVRSIIGIEWIRKYFSGDWEDADVLSATWNAGAYSDTIRGIESFSCEKPGVFFCEPELTPLIEASNRAFDPAEREALLQEIMRKLHELAPAIFLYNQSAIITRHPRVDTAVLSSGGFLFERMHMTAD